MRIIFVCVLFLLVCCQSKESVPNHYQLASERSLHFNQDTLYSNNTRFSGWLYELSTTGDTLLLESYLLGLKNGSSRKWYADHQLAEERFYEDGRKESTHHGWWPNGKLQFEFDISNDEYQNEFKEWNSEGQLIKFFHYKNGHEEGSQRLWYDDGKVRANYVIVEGRRYGLLGTKNCVNVSDSVFKK